MLDFDSMIDLPAELKPQLPPGCPEPVWEIATMYPRQGDWSADDYLSLTDGTNRLIEFTAGRLEFLAVPTELHQLLLIYLFDAFRSFVEPQDGKVMLAGMRVQVGRDRFREPDIAILTKSNVDKRANRFWHGADIVIEIVSADAESRQRDYVTKKADYAEGRIPEYWIVDPHGENVTVLALADGATEYTKHGVFGPSETATSRLLDGFAVDVSALFAAGKDARGTE